MSSRPDRSFFFHRQNDRGEEKNAHLSLLAAFLLGERQLLGCDLHACSLAGFGRVRRREESGKSEKPENTRRATRSPQTARVAAQARLHTRNTLHTFSRKKTVSFRFSTKVMVFTPIRDRNQRLVGATVANRTPRGLVRVKRGAQGRAARRAFEAGAANKQLRHAMQRRTNVKQLRHAAQRRTNVHSTCDTSILCT
jgi:hypothetical protein